MSAPSGARARYGEEGGKEETRWVVVYRRRRERMPPTALSAQGLDLPLIAPQRTPTKKESQQTMEGG
jgi:hypothetical protein